ncbi:hypothetical protein [Bacillus mycoides]|uniref:hypothetical protein n=1 Tax=Bacillus mycoides TaxID=1405 RepID=UPI002112A9C6|nr:hypothetical protein [Bacillus mycoides]MCQ6530741.1 hypothetical protein [Bacillus mycoides]
MEGFFINDLKEEIGSLSGVKGYSCTFENYNFEEIKEEKFIVGEYTEKTVSDYEIKDKNLLFSLLSLVKGALPDNFFQYPFTFGFRKSPQKNKLETIISDENIFEWVKEYGIPYEDKVLNRLLNDEQWRLNYLHLNLFRWEIARLYSFFSIWKSLLEEDFEEIEKYTVSIWDLRMIMFEDKKNNPNSPTDKIYLIKKALAQEISHWTKVEIKLKYDRETDRNIFELSTGSLLNVAYYQLAELLTKPYLDSKKSLKTCKMCKSLFWAEHKNSDYCSSVNPKSKCSRQNFYYRKKQKEKNRPPS